MEWAVIAVLAVLIIGIAMTVIVMRATGEKKKTESEHRRTSEREEPEAPASERLANRV